MRCSSHGAWDRGLVAVLAAMVLTATGILTPTVAQTATTKPSRPAPSDVTADATVEELFTDFLHYARLGQFTASAAHAKALLAHPDLDPVLVMELANRDREAIDTLRIIIRNAKDLAFVEAATRVMELIERGAFMRRQDAERIQANIELLIGTPQQEAMATRHLADAGEYAVPLMVKALLNRQDPVMRAGILRALPHIRKPAVNPLVVALNVEDNNIRQDLIEALGKIGYPQAIPYLRKAQANPKAFPETQKAAADAVSRIENKTGRAFPGATDELFFQLAERYYDEDEDVRADPRLDEANVWYWEPVDQALKAVVVPRRIFGQVMAMRCSEEAMLVRNDHADAIGLWLAANIQREDHLDLDVESGDPAEPGQQDATRPAIFPRALYFTQAAGPRYAHRVLARAVRNNDSAVALGAIQALRTTAGESSLIGAEDFKQPLAQCLRFPDLVVRIKAALALGSALPKTGFQDAQFVVPVLAQTLTQTGRQQVIVVDAEGDNGNRVTAVLKTGDRDVITDTSFFRALDRARAEFQMVSAVFVSTDVADPGVAEAVRDLRGEFAFAKTPVVLLVKKGQSVAAEDIARKDYYVERVDASAADAAIEAALERARGRAGHSPLQPEAALRLALQAAETLRRIAVDGRTVFNVSDAAPALISVLSGSDEQLQKTAASVLALIPAPAAQRAIAHVALDDKRTKTLRGAAFGSLAESARANGNLLEDAQTGQLVRIVLEDPDLVIRTAATDALGALNLTTDEASKIIRNYYGG